MGFAVIGNSRLCVGLLTSQICFRHCSIGSCSALRSWPLVHVSLVQPVPTQQFTCTVVSHPVVHTRQVKPNGLHATGYIQQSSPTSCIQ